MRLGGGELERAEVLRASRRSREQHGGATARLEPAQGGDEVSVCRDEDNRGGGAGREQSQVPLQTSVELPVGVLALRGGKHLLDTRSVERLAQRTADRVRVEKGGDQPIDARTPHATRVEPALQGTDGLERIEAARHAHVLQVP